MRIVSGWLKKRRNEERLREIFDDKVPFEQTGIVVNFFKPGVAEFRGVIDENELLMGDLSVDKELRNMGVATKILSDLENFAKIKNLANLHGNVFPEDQARFDLRGFYERRGFEIIPPQIENALFSILKQLK